MGRDAEPAEPLDVFDNVLCIPAQGIRGCRHIEGNVVAAVGADLDSVEAQHPVQVGRRIRRPRRVAMIGDDDELKSGARGGRRNRVAIADAVGARTMNVERASDGATANAFIDGTRRLRRSRRQRGENKNKNGGQNGRRPRQRPAHLSRGSYTPASARNAFALSVCSHENSGSVRPK